MSAPETCDTCAARCNGIGADYCYHAAFTGSESGKRIPHYPTKPSWCPGYIAEDDDYEWA